MDETQLYIQSAILGLLLAIILIMGLKRLLPCVLFFAWFTAAGNQALASSVDEDNDVPSINLVTAQVLAMQTMLDNYFSGYTSPNKLNDISNALYKSGNPVLTTIDNRLDTLVDSQHTSGISSAVFLYDIQQYIQGNYSGPLTSLAGRTFDSDDDVPTLQNIETNVTDLDLHTQASLASVVSVLQSIQSDMNSTESAPTAQTITPDPITAPTFNERIASNDAPAIDYDITAFKDSIDIEPLDGIETSFSQGSIPLFQTGTIPTVAYPDIGGDFFAEVNTKMGQHFNTLAAIFLPILTGFLVFVVFKWTTKTTINNVAN